jgi:hypothetical protein
MTDIAIMPLPRKALIIMLNRQAAEIEALQAELDRRDVNETRNCINYGPCSRFDGRMEHYD